MYSIIQVYEARFVMSNAYDQPQVASQATTKSGTCFHSVRLYTHLDMATPKAVRIKAYSGVWLGVQRTRGSEVHSIISLIVHSRMEGRVGEARSS